MKIELKFEVDQVFLNMEAMLFFAKLQQDIYKKTSNFKTTTSTNEDFVTKIEIEFNINNPESKESIEFYRFLDDMIYKAMSRGILLKDPFVAVIYKEASDVIGSKLFFKQHSIARRNFKQREQRRLTRTKISV